MIDLGTVANVAAIAVAALAGAVVGGKRGVSSVTARTQHELEVLVEAQDKRIAHLERENALLETRIGELEAELVRLREELKVERRITARIQT